ncbi:transcriptional regulator [uncultured Methylibium sp.]|uniref:transcriptional regulator n=1 Tax=uncultured Methylibium sp. TaxID=381093 RepID=UPI0025CDEFF9|nr:transcriptional regulator [uncultured Methylibium sp.]
MGTNDALTLQPAVTPDAGRTSLADALFSRTQQRVLGLLFGQPGRSFYASELIALTGSGSGAVQRELARLAQSGLVAVRVLGRQKHYQANPDSPVFAELCGIAGKTMGLADPLRQALMPLGSRIRAAFVYGSVAKRQDTASSDIDLMLVSDDLSYPDVFGALEVASQRLGREVKPTIYSRQEWAERAARGDGFVKRVLAQPRIWLIGSDDALAES